MTMYPQPYKPAVQVERMEDLPIHPRLLAERAEQERLEQERVMQAQKAARRKAQASAQKQRTTGKPQTQTHAPQLPTAQRQRNQAGQPRETDGKYAGKPGSKWKQFLSPEPAPRTSLKKIEKKSVPSVRSSTARPQAKKKRPVPMSAVEHRNPLVKAHWWVTRGFGQWRRKKDRQIRKAFSLRG